MAKASLLTGNARGPGYAGLDRMLMSENPPWAPLVNSNDRIFLSARVSCVTVNEAAYGILLNVLCVK